ncbi:YraN family protein [Marinicella litoralis]|uniref:UPF0102 protein C8D91_1798 n=1 Tax=Marinicella litoralis TaxID=644220 RepID=A0A4R6XRF0_9GAMM|nr:YraN family protein [Marinicella litoralis]TDR20820.1 putative endonuclease [Marinicella litoralis]
MGTISQWFNQIYQSLIPRVTNRGQIAEHKAEHFLLKQGLTLLVRNYQTKAGEIDLIMSHQQALVFVEVRYKSNTEWAHPAESVTVQKQRKIIKAAKHYLLKHDPTGRKACRFDVIAMSGELESPKINWLQHAFY